MSNWKYLQSHTECIWQIPCWRLCWRIGTMCDCKESNGARENVKIMDMFDSQLWLYVMTYGKYLWSTLTVRILIFLFIYKILTMTSLVRWSFTCGLWESDPKTFHLRYTELDMYVNVTTNISQHCHQSIQIAVHHPHSLWLHVCKLFFLSFFGDHKVTSRHECKWCLIIDWCSKICHHKNKLLYHTVTKKWMIWSWCHFHSLSEDKEKIIVNTFNLWREDDH